eukprot:gene1160-4054_t
MVKAPLLFSLVFGEGIINDATSVVLVNAISRSVASTSTAGQLAPPGTESPDEGVEPHGDARLLFGIVLSFLYLFTTSLFLGLGAGLGISFLMRKWRSHEAHH